ncbi:MAG: bifunctional 3-demethylubiquinone-9 3-methyltransferase/2-octaprenyl-6-hydroxy phenol methylase [Humibacillus sp.]|nr:bifunctional 3-demethylubiquinone-9 3-methyltransferase/2-octaprenyl-6-hydroxy phenol methylase [Humibacillus sp.]
MTGAFHHADPGTPEQHWRDAPEWATLPALELDSRTTACVLVVAAHPDDETLGAAGLLATAAAAGIDAHVLLLTCGEASHPDSPTQTPDELATLRVEETIAAVSLVHPGARVTSLGIPDGDVAGHEDEVVTAVVDAVGETGSRTLVCAPWRHDGHTDHDAAGRAAAVAAHRTDARLLEYPIWLWHRAAPAEAPWPLLRRLDLDPGVRDLKARAVEVHRSQVAPLSDQPGDETLLHAGVLEHLLRPHETFVASPPVTEVTFDRVHEDAADPWSVDSWYERRKRALTLASLPRERFGRALEVGCSIGALTAALSSRCDEVLALDESGVAVAAARRRLADQPGVTVDQAHLPLEWPEGRFDLVVVSEVGYFLSPARLALLIERAEGCLTDGGTVVLCHWRHDVVGWPLDGPRVHELWRSSTRLALAVEHRETDVLLDVLTDAVDHRADPT